MHRETAVDDVRRRPGPRSGPVRAFAPSSLRGCLAALLLTALTTPVTAQEAEQIPRPTFETTSSLVVLDIVVRDRKGNPVRDLRADEVQVSEDGVPRELTAFRLVEGQASEERVHPDEASGLQPDPSRQVSLVTFVFDKLLDNRQLARDAALSFLDNNMEENVWIAVFTIDQRLILRQKFSQDPYLVRQAILQATGTTSVTAASLAATANQQERLAEQSTNVAEAAAGAAPAGQGTGGAVDTASIGTAAAEAQMAEVIANILRFSDTLQRQQQGQSTLYPLLSLVKAQGRLAGRKTLVYFSEGLVVPKNLEEVFTTTISEANRANVTVYAIDARGLNSSRDSEVARQQLLNAARASAQQMAKRGAGAVTVEEVMIAENAEESLRANVQTSLGELAESTGGFLAANTNDFRPAMARVATDIGSYYEAAYVPVSQEYDGQFRKISVKVTRPGVTVQSRSGYFALPPGEGSALLPFEMPLLTALTVDPPPHDFDYRAAALQFAPVNGLRDHVLILEVPLDGMSFEEDRRQKTYRLRFSLLALVKDAEGRVVERFSDNYPFEGPLDKLDQIRRGNLIFRRPFSLAPGEYQLEFVAQDRDTGRTSVEREPLVVPPAASCAVSSIAVIRRLDDATPDIPADDPFLVRDMRIVPNLEVPVSKAQNAHLSVYFVVYTAPNGQAPLTAMEILSGDAVVGRATLELPAADANGRIPYIGTFPIEALAPGVYSVRVLVQQGEDVAVSETSFTLVD